MEISNFFTQINEIHTKCFANINQIIGNYVNNTSLTNQINDEINKAFLQIDNKYVNEYKNIIDNNRNNVANDNNNKSSEENEDEDEDEDEMDVDDDQIPVYKEGVRRKFYLLVTKSLGDLRTILNYFPKLKYYEDHRLKRERVDIQDYNYWVLLMLSQRSTLRNEKVCNSIYNHIEKSKEGYLEFLELHGEDFHF